tara:strand:- start:126 stop:548 length:423 start_codon:yes stop_codon:yes gene_type:complete
LIEGVCEGCRFHDFPYKAKSTIRNKEGKFPYMHFEEKEDVLDYASNLIEEAKTLDRKNTPVIKSLYYQLPFFACPNVFLDASFQKDITKYLYCQDNNVPPHKGSYGDTPRIWREKHFLIKSALSILQEDKRREMQEKNKK